MTEEREASLSKCLEYNAYISSDRGSGGILSSSLIVTFKWFVLYDNFGVLQSEPSYFISEDGISSKFPGSDIGNTVSWVFRWSPSVITFNVP